MSPISYLSVADRFWRKVVKYDSGCWEWTGATNGKGYGRFNNQGFLVYPHRFAFELANGGIPDGMTLDHLCRNRACVNPDHLEIVTNKENVLRGIGLTAINARVTHCSKGHPYDLFNTYYTHSGSRGCKICRKDFNYARYH